MFNKSMRFKRRIKRWWNRDKILDKIADYEYLKVCRKLGTNLRQAERREEEWVAEKEAYKLKEEIMKVGRKLTIKAMIKQIR
jgi:hypothetical protein